jgi:hypothetical protein
MEPRAGFHPSQPGLEGVLSSESGGKRGRYANDSHFPTLKTLVLPTGASTVYLKGDPDLRVGHQAHMRVDPLLLLKFERPR